MPQRTRSLRARLVCTCPHKVCMPMCYDVPYHWAYPVYSTGRGFWLPVFPLFTSFVVRIYCSSALTGHRHSFSRRATVGGPELVFTKPEIQKVTLSVTNLTSKAPRSDALHALTKASYIVNFSHSFISGLVTHFPFNYHYHVFYTWALEVAD